MRALVIGSGQMGYAIASDLAGHGFQVTVSDSNPAAARSLAEKLKCPWALSDASKPASMKSLLKAHDVAVSAVPYFFNVGLATAAVEAGSHFVDLGGNEEVVRKELKLDRAAKKKGVCVVPDCGLAPGMAGFLVALGVEEVGGRPRRVKIRVGGLPQKPTGPLKYQLVFSIHGLINEYDHHGTTLRNGKISRSKSMTGIEKVDFPGLGELEAFHTSGGSSTMPWTYQGRVRALDYKTLRYPGHCAKFRKLMDSMSREDLFAWCAKNLPSGKPDLVAVKVEVDDWSVRILDRKTGPFTAMMRTTGYPAAIVASLIARGHVKRKGALLQERDFDPKEFARELEARGIRLLRD